MKAAHENTYTCPMHPEIVSAKLGKCPKCGMELVVMGAHAMPQTRPHSAKHKISVFLPLIIIFGVLVAVSYVQVLVLRRYGGQHTIMHPGMDTGTVQSSFDSSWQVFMASFMGGFFIIFGAFKLLDLKGFSYGFRTYDLIAQGLPTYGYIYPFLELGLGLLFLLHKELVFASAVALAVSTIGLVSVGNKLRKREKVQCVCLGTVFDLPLTNITLFENLIMASMAIGMLAI